MDWQYVHKVLELMGFGVHFCRWVALLYGSLQVVIRLEFCFPLFFPIGRGMGQGYPLSPFLFAVMMEPLVIALRSSPEVKALRLQLRNALHCTLMT